VEHNLECEFPTGDRAAMLRATLVLGIALWVVSCKPAAQPTPGGPRLGSYSLVGVWTAKVGFASGDEVSTTITVAPDGSYVCSSKGHSGRFGNFESRLAGVIRVEDGYLIDTITNDSRRDAKVPETTRNRIVRLSGDELVLDPVGRPKDNDQPTNEFVYRRQTN